MAKAHSSRGRAARRTRINSSTPKSKPIKPSVADQSEEFDEILGRFSDALALAETACSALEAAEEDEELIAPGVLTLSRLLKNPFRQPASAGPWTARRNQSLQGIDFGSAAKVTPFASDVEKAQDGLFQHPVRRGIDDLNRVYTDLDLAILRLD